jgi:hypothetical protein
MPPRQKRDHQALNQDGLAHHHRFKVGPKGLDFFLAHDVVFLGNHGLF